ncbi:MAG: hypothetical protein KatS3mg096_298 [Candidatus Parcubacteria bacterium]|nr:MAG: hypothetical protein KatS3mg096_298 [Candidatus Parcubacteria bacterium]
MKKIFYLVYFLLPFFLWFLIYLKKPDLIVIFKRPIFEKSLIIPIEDLWQIILIFAIFQFGNEVLTHLISKKIFGKINLIFIFFHFLVVLYLLIFNLF